MTASARVGRSPSWSVLADSSRAPETSGEELPWRAREVTRASWVIATGLIGLAVCWYGVRDSKVFTTQLHWLVGGTAAVALSTCGMVGWLLAGLRSVRTERRHLLIGLAELRAARGLATAVPGPAQVVRSSGSAVEGYVTATAMTRYHLPSCLLMRGKTAVEVTEGDSARLGLSACAVCGS